MQNLVNICRNIVMARVQLPKGQCTELHGMNHDVSIHSGQWHIVLCSCIEHFTLTLSLSFQVYKWVLVTFMAGNNTIYKITRLYYVHPHWLINVLDESM